MPLTNVLSVQVRPEESLRYVELIAQLAKRAVEKKERFRWTAHQTLFGAQGPWLHFVSEADSWSALGARGTPQEMFARVLGAKAAADWQREVLACSQAQRNTLSMDRPDLSYPPDQGGPAAHPLAAVTLVRVRPGGQEAVEELLRKIAEAIPKVDDAARILAFQTLLGDLREYWTVRPLRDLAELDRHRLPGQLLVDAFGAGEGGLVFRTGMEAIESAEREIVQYLPELSNPA
jgi:hypothetical protein